MFVITDPARMWVQLDAAESQLASLKPGKQVQLRSAAWPDQTFAATLENISDSIDPVSRTVKVRGSVENRERKLKGEMFVTAEIQEAASTTCRSRKRPFCWWSQLLRLRRGEAGPLLAPGSEGRRRAGRRGERRLGRQARPEGGH